MHDIDFYIFMLIGLPILMFFIFRGQDKVLRARNKKRRYGLFVTATLFSVPFWIVIILFNNIKVISTFTTVNIKIVAVVVFALFYIIAAFFNKIIFIPADYKKYEKERILRKQNFKSWKYYILEYPASSLKNILELPPISKWSKSDPKLVKEYHAKSLKLPPIHIQLIILIIVYMSTSLAFYILDHIMGSWLLIYINAYVLPFILLVALMGYWIFGIIRFLEYIFKIKMNEVVKFLLFNIIFVVVVSGVVLYTFNN